MPPTKTSETESPPAPRDAVIFLPGLAIGLTPKAVGGIVSRIGVAFDHQSAGSSTWEVVWTDAAVRGDGAEPTTPVATIIRKDEDVEQPVLDFFEYRWTTRLSEGWETQNLFHRALRTLLAVFMPRTYRAFWAGRHTKRGRFQLAMAGFLLVVMLIYTAILLWAVYDTIDQLVLDQLTNESSAAAATNPTTSSEPVTSVSPDPSLPTDTIADEEAPGDEGAGGDATDSDEVTWRQWITVAGAAAIGFSKKQSNRVSSAGGALFAAKSYLDVGAGQPQAIGGLEALGNHLYDQGDLYKSIHIIGYSFGAIVALDTLFPTTQKPRRFVEKVDTLVTLGAPFDFVEAVKPGWRMNRKLVAGVPKSWVNIYNPVDLLGANFRNDNKDGEPQRGLTTGIPERSGVLRRTQPDAAEDRLAPDSNVPWDLNVELTAGNIAQLYGLRVHGMYWGTDVDTAEHNVFSAVVDAIYEGKPALA